MYTFYTLGIHMYCIIGCGTPLFPKIISCEQWCLPRFRSLAESKKNPRFLYSTRARKSINPLSKVWPNTELKSFHKKSILTSINFSGVG
jgi:hypothetical protein